MSVISDNQSRFRVTWRDPATDRRRQRTFPTLAEALRFHDTLARTTQPRDADPSTVAGLCGQAVTARAVSASTTGLTRPVRRNSITPFFADRPATQLSTADVQAWVDWMATERHYSPSTVHHHFQVLAATTRWAVQAQLLHHDPCRRVHLPRAPCPAMPPALFRTPVPDRVATGSAGATSGHNRAVDSPTRMRTALDDPSGHDLDAILRPQQLD